jgi:GTPase
LDEQIATIGRELHAYSEKLEQLPQILVLNKCDIVDAEHAEEIADVVWSNVDKLLPAPQHVTAVIPISCATGYGINELKNTLYEELSKLPQIEETASVSEDLRAREHPDEGFSIERRKNRFIISGNRLERLVDVTNMRSPESIQHLVDVMRAMGVIDGLLEAGAEPGSEIIIGESEFTFGEDML